MKGICIDCNKEVEINDHGRCISCGSSSTIPKSNPLAALHPVIVVDTLLQEVNKITDLLAHEPPSVYSRAAIDFISARMSIGLGLSIGQHLENILSMWTVASEIRNKEEEKSAKGN